MDPIDVNRFNRNNHRTVILVSSSRKDIEGGIHQLSIITPAANPKR